MVDVGRGCHRAPRSMPQGMRKQALYRRLVVWCVQQWLEAAGVGQSMAPRYRQLLLLSMKAFPAYSVCTETQPSTAFDTHVCSTCSVSEKMVWVSTSVPVLQRYLEHFFVMLPDAWPLEVTPAEVADLVAHVARAGGSISIVQGQRPLGRAA